jgi:hypothetical protein
LSHDELLVRIILWSIDIPADWQNPVTTGGTPSVYGQQVTLTASMNGEYGLVKGRTGASEYGSGSY